MLCITGFAAKTYEDSVVIFDDAFISGLTVSDDTLIVTDEYYSGTSSFKVGSWKTANVSFGENQSVDMSYYGFTPGADYLDAITYKEAARVVLKCIGYQAEFARELYTLWFAHSSVDAIIWWNLVTGGEYSTKFWDEGYFDGSLVNKDFTKKTAHDVLSDLINNKWKTNVVLDNEGENNLCGFYGKYTATYEKNGKTTTCDFHLNKGNFNNFVIEI